MFEVSARAATIEPIKPQSLEYKYIHDSMRPHLLAIHGSCMFCGCDDWNMLDSASINHTYRNKK